MPKGREGGPIQQFCEFWVHGSAVRLGLLLLALGLDECNRFFTLLYFNAGWMYSIFRNKNACGYMTCIGIKHV